MFGKRRNNRGMIWGSLISLGVSAAAYGMRRNRNRNMFRPIRNFMNNLRIGTVQKPNTAGLTEFSKELIPNKNQNTNK